MCGFFFTLTNNNKIINKNDFIKSLNLIAHRGPDDFGFEETNVGNHNLNFGFRRLAIQDLSKNANQPFISKNGNILLFNGEIYNHKELRKLLNKEYLIEWKTSSDTETIVNFVDILGIDTFLKHARGMFAFLIYDKSKNKIIICRDHAGEKPLYMCLKNNFISLSSDLSPIINLNYYKKEIDLESVNEFLNFNYIPNPKTIYKNIFKIPPGTRLNLDLNTFKLIEYDTFEKLKYSNGVNFDKWWNYPLRKKNNFNYENYIDQLDLLLNETVQKQLLSDAPLGAFLSGGTDSSLIVAVASKYISKLKTFTVGFDYDNYDESVYAKKISDQIGTDHYSVICNKDDVMNSLSSLHKIYTEPFADSSQIPTLLVSKIAKINVKVALSGDGGDEIFGGYNRYHIANKYWWLIKLLPYNLRKLILNTISFLPTNIIDLLIKTILSKKITRNNSNAKNIINKLIHTKTEYDFYNSFISEYKNNSIMNKDIVSLGNYAEIYNSFDYNNTAENMMACDFVTYLSDDILCKVDRASMYNSLETRAPYLDINLIDYVVNLPFSQKIKNNQTKFIQKKLLSKYIPSSLFNRPKMGFGIPLGKWFHDDLNNLMNDSLSNEMLNKHNLFDNNKVLKLKKNHLSYIENNENKLWALIQFNLWYENNF